MKVSWDDDIPFPIYHGKVIKKFHGSSHHQRPFYLRGNSEDPTHGTKDLVVEVHVTIWREAMGSWWFNGNSQDP